MIKQYLQTLFVLSSISFLAGCSTFREAGNDFSTWINGSNQEHQTAPTRRAPQPAAEPTQTETNPNINAAATASGTIVNKPTNTTPKTNIIPVTSQPVNPAPIPKTPTDNEDQNNPNEPEVRSTPNTE